MPDRSERVLYLDIDGVLLRRRHTGMFDAFEIAPGCLDVLEWATARFRCLWLSSRCRQGWPDGARRAFRHAGALRDDPRWGVLDLIEPAAWTITNSEAIDLASDCWWWLEDDPIEADRNWLRAHSREDRLIKVSCNGDPDAMAVARTTLERAILGQGRITTL